MSLDEIRNAVRQDAIKKLLAVDQILGLTDTIRTVLTADRQKIDDS